MATTRPTLASLAKQTERLCLAQRLCPKHPKERLWCGPCHLSWEGTPQEFDELIALAERLPYAASPGPTPYRCKRCQERLWCDGCFRAEMARTTPSREGTMPLSDEELDRYQKLSAYLTFREHSAGLPPIVLHWGDPERPEATEPEPTAGVTLEHHVDAPPVPGPRPAPEPEPEPADDGDDEADVDAELADLLAQLQRRLGR
jgi:hypothetical protein